MPERPLSSSQSIAAMMRTDAARLRQPAQRLPIEPLTVGFDPDRESRLDGLCEGLVPTVAEQHQLEQRISELRQASGSAAAFRQALFLLCKVQGIDALRRSELMRRAMNWYRARKIASGQLATPWAKSMVAIAQAQRGRI